MTATIDIAPGARATEDRLLQRLAELRDQARRDPTLLGRPVRVIVPSGSLRLHLSERITAELGAVAGVFVQTLHAAAQEILERAGIDVPGGDALVEVLAQRMARDEEPLREAFETFRDGYRGAAGTLRDLFDAGFEPALAEAVGERLDAVTISPEARRRAQALVRAAARVAGELEQRGHGGAGRSGLLGRAREAFEADPQRTLPCRALLVHGFADATGRATDLIEALARRLTTEALFDLPDDPLEATRVDLGSVYTERLVGRLRGVAQGVTELPREGDAPELDLFRAPGAGAEAREVARRLHALLEGGARPERIAVVARDLTGYRAALRLHFTRLGIPHSGLGARSPLDGPGRRIHALVELLESRDRCPADRWLDLVQRIPAEREGESVLRRPSLRLRLGLRMVGAARLGDVADLTPDELLEEDGRLRLPLRTGVRPAGDPGADAGEGDGGNGGDTGRPRRFSAPQARLQGFELRGAVDAAGALVRRLDRWPSRASVARHLEELARLRRSDLRWRAGDPAEQRLRPALAQLAEDLPDEELGAEEFVLLVGRTLPPRAAPALGGAGGGVAVLDAMEARARTFDHLFVLGLNRDVFPRVGREDPLLGDDLRGALADLLPDIPIAARSRDEDRYLFAQLVSASPRVTLSWQLADDDGKPRVISPLVERLLWERSEEEEEVGLAAPLFPQDRVQTAGSGPRTAHERAVLGGLHGGRKGFAGRLARALSEADSGPDPGAVAGVRERVLLAYEKGPFEPRLLGPWLGFLGPQDGVGVRPDPLRERPFVTGLESMARCPWSMVLGRLLRLGPSPDPLESLPGIEPRMVGQVVHRVLERMARQVLGDGEVDLAAALGREPLPVPWPEGDHFETLLLEVARAEVRRDRPPVPGLVRAVAECARAHLDRARDLLAGAGGVLGVEVEGIARVACGEDELEIGFRADRVDRRGKTVVLTDYKTGKPVTDKELRNRGIRRGRSLQPMAYVLGAAGVDGSLEVRGQYLYLSADEDRGQKAEVTLAGHEDRPRADFTAAVGTLFTAWREGAFLPRVATPEDKEPDACRYCDVSIACVREDSGARRALVAWGAGGDAKDGPPTGAVAAMGALWRLSVAEAPKEKGKGKRS